MPTVAIPKEVSKNKEFVAVPRGLYDEFVEWQRKIKSVRTFKPTAAEKKALARARKNRAAGKFLTLDELKRKLDFTRLRFGL